MNISNLQQIHSSMAQQVANTQASIQPNVQSKDDSQRFGNLFVQQLQATNQMQHRADVELQNFMIGESDNLHNVMLAMEEASISLQFTTQVRNRVIEAYQEIRNMQI